LAYDFSRIDALPDQGEAQRWDKTTAVRKPTRERNIAVETSSDEKFLYIWRADALKPNGATE
jgi:hypothetical protein